MYFRRIFCALILAGSCVSMCLSDMSLPVITREGVAYFQYQVKDGESLYGIAKSMGWDYDLLAGLNPGVSERLSKGAVLIYPTGETAEVLPKKDDLQSAPVVKNNGSVTYEVQSSQSPYEVAKILDVTTEQLYAQNPWTRRGLRKGDKVIIDYDKLETEEPLTDASSADPSVKVESSVAGRFNRISNDAEESKDEIIRKTDVVSSYRKSVVPDVDKENEQARQGVSARNPLLGLDRDMLMEYTIQPGENVADVAKNFNTTVRDIFFLNRGLSESWFPAGIVINILPGSKDLDHKKVVLKSRVKEGEKVYKIKKGDTWESVAEANNLTVPELRDANRNLKEFKKGKKITVPTIVTHSEVQDAVFSDPRENTSEGRNEIHREVASYGRPEKHSDNLFDIAVLTSRTSADLKRDREFLRGFLVGVKDAEVEGKKFGVQVIDVTDRRLASVYMNEANDNSPDLIIATFEKDFPDDLVNYASSHGAGVVNVFDAKSTSVNSEASMFQVLMPTEMMNEKIASELLDRFHSRKFVFIDENYLDSDSYAYLLKQMLKDKGIAYLSYSAGTDMRSLDPSGSEGYVIISNANTQSAISSTLHDVEVLRESYPNIPISVVGRPTWIVYAEKMKQALKGCDTFIPSRFFYDEDSLPYRRFSNRFSEYYNVEPTASFPPYAAMGYDVARYFISSMVSNGGDNNRKVSVPEGVEISFDFNRQSAGSGLVNTALYLIHYSKSGVRGLTF